MVSISAGKTLVKASCKTGRSAGSLPTHGRKSFPGMTHAHRPGQAVDLRGADGQDFFLRDPGSGAKRRS
jgi:hypothetical protein